MAPIVTCRVLTRLAGTLALAAGVAACQDAAEPVAPPAAAVAAPAAIPAPASTEVRPRVLGVSPEGIRVSNGRGSGQLTVEYAITNPDRVEHAELELWAPGVGRVARTPVPAVARGSASITVNGDIDLGPSLRFRVRCAAGDSEWVPLGTRGRADDGPPGLRIASVHPESISLDQVLVTHGGEIPAGTGVAVRLAGPGLGSGCTPEAAVNGRLVSLSNPHAKSGRAFGTVGALLRYSDVGLRSVASRFLEVKLHVRGPRLGSVAIERVPFLE